MAQATLRVLPSPEAIGDSLAAMLLDRIEAARRAGSRFLLGCPTGRTPRPVYEAMARRLAGTRQDIAHVVLVMMDEYLVPGDEGLVHAPAGAPWSCRRFAREEIVARLAAPLPAARRLPDESVWFPDPRDPEAYDRRIAEAGGIDYFLLASGASDGHVAFNPPGSARGSRTRIVALSEETRRDNLQTFPSFGSLDAVPHHGISVGIATIAEAREASMVVWGDGKRLTLARMLRAERYDPAWPATVIHECAGAEIVSDAAAAGTNG
ncbi:MAG TPA: 6-phosphogluconolactonase [Gemmatimonadaceae bacterium]